MKEPRNRSAFKRLFDVASQQDGYFTAQQAEACGFDPRNHAFHVRQGNWLREERGVFRLATYPVSSHGDLVRWFLWSRNRKGTPQGVYSHETALALYELSDLMPAKLHMTVPKTFRRSRPTPKVLILHRGELITKDTDLRHGVRVTRPLRAIVDLLNERTTSRDHLRQALHEAIDRGWIRMTELKNSPLPPKTRKALEELLGKAA